MFGDYGIIRAVRVISGAPGRKIGHKKHEKSQKQKRLDTRSGPTPESPFGRASTASPRQVYRTRPGFTLI